MTTSTHQRIDRASSPPSRRGWWREHLPFLVALALGAAVRVVVSLAFTPSLVITDSVTYLRFLEILEPNPERPVGYSVLLLYPLSWLTDSLAAVAVTQHLLGLATAVLLYVLLRRWGVGRWLGALATLPVLLDAMQLLLEQTPLSDTFFVFLVTLGVVLLGWRRRPTVPLALAAGLLLGASATVRTVGVPLVLAGAGYCLLANPRWRTRLTTAAALALAFAAPLVAYAGWYHAAHGVYALTTIGGKSAYMRTTPFVDCSTLDVPDYQRVLCPPEPRRERLDPTIYAWHDPRTLPRLDPPPGTSHDEAMGEFGVAAVRAQPLDYVAVVLRDAALNFDVWRGNRFEYELAYRWRFSHYIDAELENQNGPAYAAYLGQPLSTHQPYADALVGYQRVVYLPGPVLLVCLLLGLLGSFGVGRARRSGLRAIALLVTACGAGLMLVPDITTQFVWRYQLPAIVLLPAAAALGMTALRGRHGGLGGQPDDPTNATPSTDWPNGGATRLSSNRVTGTTQQS